MMAARRPHWLFSSVSSSGAGPVGAGEASSAASEAVCGEGSAAGSVGMSTVSELCDCDASDNVAVGSALSVLPLALPLALPLVLSSAMLLMKASAKTKVRVQVVRSAARQSTSLSKTEDQQLISETCSTSTCGVTAGRAEGRREVEGKRVWRVADWSEGGRERGGREAKGEAGVKSCYA